MDTQRQEGDGFLNPEDNDEPSEAVVGRFLSISITNLFNVDVLLDK